MNNTSSNEILDAMWDNFDARVWKVCDFLHLKKYELADELDMQQQRLSRLKEGKHHKEAYLILLNHPEISARWLLFGQGSMTEQPTVEQEQQQQQQPQQESREYLSLLQAYRAAIEENVRLQMTLDTLRRTLPAAAEDPAPYPRKKQA